MPDLILSDEEDNTVRVRGVVHSNFPPLWWGQLDGDKVCVDTFARTVYHFLPPRQHRTGTWWSPEEIRFRFSSWDVIE